MIFLFVCLRLTIISFAFNKKIPDAYISRVRLLISMFFYSAFHHRWNFTSSLSLRCLCFICFSLFFILWGFVLIYLTKLVFWVFFFWVVLCRNFDYGLEITKTDCKFWCFFFSSLLDEFEIFCQNLNSATTHIMT